VEVGLKSNLAASLYFLGRLRSAELHGLLVPNTRTSPMWNLWIKLTYAEAGGQSRKRGKMYRMKWRRRSVSGWYDAVEVKVRAETKRLAWNTGLAARVNCDIDLQR
jgi:hypothetical protein